MFIDTKIGRNFSRLSVERCLVICHGLPYEPGSVVEKNYYELAKFFSHDFATLVFDFSGTGLSEEQFSLLAWVEDLANIAERFDKVLLLGYSMGGAVAVRVAAESKNVEKLAVVSSPCCMDMFDENVLRAIYENARMKNILRGIGSYEDFRENFIHDFAELDPLYWIKKVGAPKLIVHGTKDDIVPFRHGEKLYEEALQPKSVVRVVNGDHFLRQREEVSGVILEWFRGKIKGTKELRIRSSQES